MDDTFKYLIHADVAADGVVERSDVVGAIFGQTEGLLGEELDLRDLQESSKIGRIDVEVASEGGQSFGDVTISSSLDRVDTAILAASLETIERVGPCRARVEVAEIEDVREAKRREVIERAKELLTDAFDDSVTTSDEIQAEVREAIRVADITEYDGLPAGPRVADTDAVILVEGRADVLALLRYGIKNAVAVEGTSVPEAVAGLAQDRTVTAFLDGDRGGELILRELRQVGDVDYATFAPEGRSVEDLPRHEVVRALQEKVRVEDLPDDGLRAAVSNEPGATSATAGTDGGRVAVSSGAATPSSPASSETVESGATPNDGRTRTEEPPDGSTDEEAGEDESDDTPPESLAAHVAAVVGEATGRARLLDADLAILDEVPASEAAAAVGDAATTPETVVLDGRLGQRLLDVLAECGVDQAVARETGEFVKRPVSVRVRTADQVGV